MPEGFARNWLLEMSLWDMRLGYADAVRALAGEQQTALVDQRAAFECRGPQCLGVLFSDIAHPNVRGHHLMARVLQELVTAEGLAVWEAGP